MGGEALKRRALVSGATGFIGEHLTRRLLTDGWEVHIVVRPSSAAVDTGVTSHTYDGTLANMLRVVGEAHPDVVFHLASKFVAAHVPQDVESLVNTNVLLGTQLLEGMAASGCTRLINTGTCWQHSGDADYEPVNLYAATKQAMEDVVQYYVVARGFEAITLQIYDTYGPGDRRNKIVSLLVKAALSGTHVGLSPGEQLLEFVYVSDVVNAYVSAAARLLEGRVCRHERYAMRAKERLSLKEIANVVERVTERTIDVTWGEKPYREREVMVPWRLGKPLVGWSPTVGLEDGLTRVVAWELGTDDV